MDDHLGEALRVLRNHAVGQGLAADLQTLTASTSGHPGAAAALGSISQVFGLAHRLQGIVSLTSAGSVFISVLRMLNFFFVQMSNHSDDSSVLLQGHHQAPPTSQSDGFTSQCRSFVI